ncbi:MAG: hypothetical protein WBN66_11315, partial [Smithella sp.]
YDKRADAENLIGEAKQEGLAAIPSGKFKNNYAFFQIVMLAYNPWRIVSKYFTHGLEKMLNACKIQVLTLLSAITHQPIPYIHPDSSRCFSSKF